VQVIFASGILAWNSVMSWRQESRRLEKIPTASANDLDRATANFKTTKQLWDKFSMKIGFS
jgi:hypothetical protein